MLEHSEPDYSQEAREAKLGGTVYLSVLIDASGQVSQIYLLHGLGMGLDRKAIEAVKKWRFKPALMHGEPVPFEMIIEAIFQTS